MEAMDGDKHTYPKAEGFYPPLGVWPESRAPTVAFGEGSLLDSLRALYSGYEAKDKMEYIIKQLGTVHGFTEEQIAQGLDLDLEEVKRQVENQNQ